MTAIDRLAEIQTRADNATDGPWAAHVDRFQDESYRDIDGAWIPGVAEKDFYEGDKPALSMLDPGDAEFIAHARADVPGLVAALRAVLDLHKPMRMYEHEDSCEDESEEHREERHVESTESIGEHYCLDLPTGITLCAECSRDLDFDGRDYPCPTAVAIEAALGGVKS